MIRRSASPPGHAVRRTLASGAALFGMLFAMTPAAAIGVAGSAGIDTSLPLTESAMALRGRGRFAGLEVTVNQTRNLANQAVSLTWTGAEPSTGFSANWLQIFQCWGEDDATNPDNPGPPPEQCQFGAEPFVATSDKIPDVAKPSNVYSRVISDASWSTFDPRLRTCGVAPVSVSTCIEPGTGKAWMPFRAVDDTVVEAQLKLRPSTDGNTITVSWQNPHFDFTTTNENPWAKTFGAEPGKGFGSDLFQVATGLEAPGLGCGQQVLMRPDGSRTMPKCWLVVVPRGTPTQENPANLVAEGNYPYVVVSPLAKIAWQNRIAFPLEFNPVEVGCAIGAEQRRIVGSEMATAAVTNWQPTLCATPGSPPYAFQAIGDDQARRQLLSSALGAAGMAVVSRPLDPARVDPEDPVTYAPLTLSGVVIGFNVERRPSLNDKGQPKDPAEVPLTATRVAQLNLTPRLVAKLLTQSYIAQFPELYRSRLPPGYDWMKLNHGNMFEDPDFLQFNPEFDVLRIGNPKTGAGLIVEAATADAATELWRWLLADPEAKAWLDGATDTWGMKVNPLFSTSASVNPTGAAFAEPLPNQYPRNDPYCKEFAPVEGVTPRPLCMLDASPYANSMEHAAQATRAANDGARTTHDPNSGSQRTGPTWWGFDGPQRQGDRSILSVTDAASARGMGCRPRGSAGPATTPRAARSWLPTRPAWLPASGPWW